MKTKIITLLLVILCIVSVSSCSKDDSEKRIEYAKIVESRSTQDLLNDLYLGSDADTEAMARIMNVTPSSIDRIRKGETEPTDQFDERIREVSIYFMQNGLSFSKLRSVLDPEWAWYNTILNFPSHHPWWFWLGTTLAIIFCIIFYHCGMAEVSGILILILIFEFVIGIIAWLCSLIFSPDAIQDNYIESINPTIEQVI